MNFSSFSKIALLTASITSLCATPLSNVQITGNQRIESETILSHITINKGDDITQSQLDQSLKNLYMTGFFKDVHIDHNGSIINIKVDENPLITKVNFEGNSKLKDDKLEEEVQIRSGEVLSMAKVQMAQQRLLEIYRQMGRFGATVEPKIIKLDQNRVNLVFEINEGNSTYIRKINFIGNKSISSSKLESAMLTKKTRWFRFFATDDTHDPNRFMADQEAIRNYYMDQGFADIQIKSAVAELSPDHKDFFLTFTLDEGQVYQFGKVNIDCQVKGIDVESLKSSVQFAQGDTYSRKHVEKTVQKMTEVLGSKGYAFAEVSPVPHKDREKKTIDLKFEIKEGAKVYIERIEIVGNDRTRVNVILREMTIHEGDAFNTVRLKDSEKRLKDLGYFKNVDIEVKQGSTPDRAKLVVRVEEQQTGEINFAVGFSTIDKALANVRFMEKNLMGTGRIVHSEVTVAKRKQDFDIGIIEPYFLGRNLEASADLFATRNTRLSAFTQVTKGGSVGLGYPITERWSQSWVYTLKQDKVSKVSPNASIILREQAGTTVRSSLGQTIAYDRRDSRLNPTSGYIISLSNAYAGLGGSVTYLRHVLSGSAFFSPIEDCVLNIRGVGGAMQRTGKTIRVIDSFMLGADSFRGFEFGGVGPRDLRTNDPLGGTRYWVGTVEFLFPLGLPSEFGVKGATGSDFGKLWSPGKKVSTVVDDKKLRASLFIGISWDSPFGPLRVDYSFPIKKQKYDDTQRLLFGFSSRF